MKINTLVVGFLETNCYIISDADANAAIIDPGANAEKIIQFVTDKNLSPRAVLLTHSHSDHIGALAGVRDKWKVPVILSAPEAEFMHVRKDDMAPFQGALAGAGFLTAGQGDVVRIGDMELEVLFTPGHTPGGICFRNQGQIFTGDTLFKDGVGRSDFPGGNSRQLMESIRTQLLVLPDDARIYPGHGPSSTIGRERDYFG